MRWILAIALLWLGVAEAAGYPPVTPGHALAFPRDGGAHPEFRTEWWYLTGWLEDAAGQPRGFQLTFFRLRSGLGEQTPGRFSPAQLILAHAALADPAEGRLRHMQRSARVSGRIAGAAPGPTRVWLRDWALRADGDDLAGEVGGDEFGFSLRFSGGATPMLNGDAGFSRKGPLPANASYYYSRPQLQVSGELALHGRRIPVTGRAWMDHEWSSELMPAGAVGWDWIGINFDDGGALMAFRMRDGAGRPIWAGGTERTADGASRALAPDEVVFEPRREWVSPHTGIRYPVEWQVRAGGLTLDLRPLMDDQELDVRTGTGTVYWEGAVSASGTEGRVGRGYLEMTGYGDRLDF